MKNSHLHKFKRILFFITSSIIIITVVVILFISPITKYLVKKYDVEYTGRQITIGRVFLNPFSGYVNIRNIKIYESKNQPALTEGDSVFFSLQPAAKAPAAATPATFKKPLRESGLREGSGGIVVIA